ncbi:MAG: Uma2 family endonuclease [Chloroflexota bacterium]
MWCCPPGYVVQPDVLWLSDDSNAVPDEGKRLRGAPELVVEILSPSTTKRDREDKFQLYEAHGTHEYCLIDPAARQISVWVRDGRQFVQQASYNPSQIFTSPALNVTVNAADIFAE